jgi:hypothetical protein
MAKAKPKLDDQTITVRIPISIRQRGGRKLVLAPDGKTELAFNRRVDNAMVKAIARAFRWQELLEDGTYATIAEVAEAEKINESYVSRVLRMTLLAPDLVEGFINGSHSAIVTLRDLLRPFPVAWPSQRKAFGVHVNVISPGPTGLNKSCLILPERSAAPISARAAAPR